VGVKGLRSQQSLEEEEEEEDTNKDRG